MKENGREMEKSLTWRNRAETNSRIGRKILEIDWKSYTDTKVLLPEKEKES